MRSASAHVVFGPCAGPVAMGSGKARPGRRVTVTRVTGAAARDIQYTIYVQGLVDKDRRVTVSGSIDVRMTAAGGPERGRCRETGRYGNGGMTGCRRRREAVA